MPKYYLTFGTQYAEEEHPHFKCANPNGWVEITADSLMNARIDACECFGDKWAFIYPEEKFNPLLSPGGRIATLEEIKEADNENLLWYKSNQPAPRVSSQIISETEHLHTLSAEKLMVMNNVAHLFGRLSTFSRMDKFDKQVNACMENILSGLSHDKEKAPAEIQYSLNVREKVVALIEAIKER